MTTEHRRTDQFNPWLLVLVVVAVMFAAMLTGLTVVCFRFFSRSQSSMQKQHEISVDVVDTTQQIDDKTQDAGEQVDDEPDKMTIKSAIQSAFQWIRDRPRISIAALASLTIALLMVVIFAGASLGESHEDLPTTVVIMRGYIDGDINAATTPAASETLCHNAGPIFDNSVDDTQNHMKVDAFASASLLRCGPVNGHVYVQHDHVFPAASACW